MTQFALAYRKAEIAKAYAEVPPHGMSNYVFRLIRDLADDLSAEYPALSNDNLWHLIYGI